jgi:hypothetical protein
MFRLCLLHPLFSSFRRHAAPSIEIVTKAAPKHFNDRERYVKKSLDKHLLLLTKNNYKLIRLIKPTVQN